MVLFQFWKMVSVRYLMKILVYWIQIYTQKVNEKSRECHNHKPQSSPSLPKFNIRFSVYCVVNIWCLLGLKSSVLNDKIVLYRVLLLLMCMDVHPNPGPSPTATSVNSLDVLHLNTRSIRNKMDYIENIAESFHILCFSETHLDASVTTNNFWWAFQKR